jgi:hypothetical protein
MENGGLPVRSGGGDGKAFDAIKRVNSRDMSIGQAAIWQKSWAIPITGISIR